MSYVLETKTLFRNDAKTRLGQLNWAGFLRDSKGVSPYPMRVFGSYALVYLLDGSGWYRDANRCAQKVCAGDLILIFPELAHSYGPGAGERWNELYLVFNGPVFDLWRSAGLLDPRRPVHRLEPIDRWLGALRAIVEAPRPATLAERLREVGRFLDFLTAALTRDFVEPAEETPGLPWLPTARALMETNLSEEIDPAQIARQVGISYETFRKGFQRGLGVSPGRYRAARRIEAACELLQHTPMTHKQIADSLGFGDEFYFSKRFKQLTGMTPRDYRQKAHPHEEG